MIRIRSDRFLLSLALYAVSLNLISIRATEVDSKKDIKNAPFGEITGYASTNVPAYSNGNDSFISYEYNFHHGIFMGIKWQCVEYARRWLFIRKGCVFDSIDGAGDMWTELTVVQRVVDGQCFRLKQHPNGSPTLPGNESLLIYPRFGKDLPYGHVAIIVDVLPGYIRVAEQNYNSHYWNRNYGREIPYALKNGSYYIHDMYPVLGWMSVEDANQTKPLDFQTIQTIERLNQSSPNFICQNIVRSSGSLLHAEIIFSFFITFIFH